MLTLRKITSANAITRLTQAVMAGILFFVAAASFQSLDLNLLSPISAFATSESPPSSTSTTTTQGGRSNGAASGNETVRIRMIATYYLFSTFGLTPDSINDHPTSEKLSDWEKKFLCGMKRVRVRNSEKTMQWLPDYLATLLHRPVDKVLESLRDPTCTTARDVESWVK